ncbi:MAG: FHA domain-containing protein [Clostridium sp.]|nr:FHA domain-containing protein [Clostridium sp.]
MDKRVKFVEGEQMNKRTIVFEIVVSVLMLLGICTMFMPYFSVTNKDINKAFEENFGDLYEDHELILEITSADDEDKEIYLIKQKNGIGLLGKLIKIETDKDLKKIAVMKKVSITALIASWTFAAITIILICVLKKKLKYILSMVSSLLSAFSLISIMFILPNVFRDALIEAIKNKLVDDGGMWQSLLVDFVEATLLDRAGGFVRDLLQNTLKLGFWIFFVIAIAAFLTSLIGLILECIKGSEVSGIVAKIMGLSGEYEGACLEIGQGILIGRSPSACQLVINSDRISRKHCKVEYNTATGKYLVTDFSSNGTYILGGKRLDENVPIELEKGTIIQLGKKGDTFRLG